MKFLDKRHHIQISHGTNLPHWQQNECIQFITFRLADSLPRERVMQLAEERAQYTAIHPEPWDKNTKEDYNDRLYSKIDAWIDAGYGSCLLKNREAREEIIGTLNYFNGQLFDLLAYVIMPNHIHLLISPHVDVSTIIRSVKRNSAIGINRVLLSSGPIWQKGYFDRLVRSASDLEHYVEYIRDNPKHLPVDSYSLGGPALETIVN